MITSQKRLKEMYREVKNLIGAETMEQVQAHISRARLFYEKQFEKHDIDITLSPYRNGAWHLSAFLPNNKGCAIWGSLTVDIEMLLDSPSEVIEKFLDYAKKSTE